MQRDLVELNNWHNDRHEEADFGLKNLGFNLCMEVKMSPERILNKTQEELRNATKESIVHTFGWPIAVFIDAKKEYSPQFEPYGIKTEISIKDSEAIVDKRYDYWAIRKDGSFYLLKSLFEDSRKPGLLFFDTRIIRTTEVLMYAFNLYSKLGLDQNDKIKIEIEYRGLKDLTMSAAGNRLIFGDYKNTNKDKSTSDPINPTLKELDERMSDYVNGLVEPLFGIFDWFKIEKNIIDEIVSNYRVGKIT